MKRSPFAIFLIAIALDPAAGFSCTRIGPVVPQEIVAQADLIVRAEAAGYVWSHSFTKATPDSLVRFRIEEVLKGGSMPPFLDLPGSLSPLDDFNETPVPYTIVRDDGRSGSCYANTYARCGDFLLMLKLRNGLYTVDWYALGPTNEQLHSPADPWLQWVRAELRDPTPVPEVVQKPRLLWSAQPECSNECPPAVIAATINKRGYVEAAKIIDGDLSPCAAAAMSALAKWGYSPASMNGQPIIVTAQFRVTGCHIEPGAPWNGSYVPEKTWPGPPPPPSLLRFGR